MIEQFFAEYWMFAGALLERASDLLGVALLNDFAAKLGLAVGEELSALSLASAALAQGFSFEGSIAAVRLAAAVIAVCLVSAMLKKALRPSRERAPAAR